MPNSWRIMVSCMEIWLAATDGDMIKVDELIYLYRLKESKEYRYYKLVPWVREARIVRDLPSSFRYWKSQFFFISRDEWKTPFGEIWGAIPKLLRRWRTPSLGASSLRQSFIIIIYLFFGTHFVIINFLSCHLVHS